MHDGGHAHDPGSVSASEERQQQAGEREVAQVVRPELHLEALARAPVGDGHHAGVVHEHVEVVELPDQPLGAAANVVEIGQVERHDLGRGSRRGFLDSLECHHRLLLVPAAHEDPSPA